MFTDPVKNLKQFGLRDDMIVADLGAGTGFYALAAAKIAERGKVYAIEIVKDYLATIKNKAHESYLKNLECFWGDVEKIGGTKIKDGIVDAVIVSNIFFQIEDKENFINEIKRISKIGGKVLLIDWTNLPKQNGDFPQLHPNKKESLTKEKVLELFQKKGFAHERDLEMGEHHYGMILVKL
jgi:ubiquinone/menaquinone biosynthesis C-methylase UbiE